MRATATTADTASVRRLDSWRDVLRDVFIELECEQLGAGAFSGSILAQGLGPLVVSEVTATPHRVVRSQQAVARGQEDHFYVGAPLTPGVRIEQGRRAADLLPGDLALYDTARPYTLSLTGLSRIAVWKIPRPFLLMRAPGIEACTAVRVSGASGLGATVSEYLTLAARRAPELTAQESAALAVSLGDLLAAALAARAPDDPSAVADAHFERAKAYIEENLARPTLRPADVAAAVGYSTRQLSRLFAIEGTTIARYVLHRRLAVCARELTRPQAAHKTITQIAFDTGFTGGAHFSRAFRRHFGVAPRDYRADGLLPDRSL